MEPSPVGTAPPSGARIVRKRVGKLYYRTLRRFEDEQHRPNLIARVHHMPIGLSACFPPMQRVRLSVVQSSGYPQEKSLCIFEDIQERGRVAHALDLAGITNTVGAPFLRALCGRGGPPAPAVKLRHGTEIFVHHSFTRTGPASSKTKLGTKLGGQIRGQTGRSPYPASPCNWHSPPPSANSEDDVRRFSFALCLSSRVSRRFP